MNGDKAGTHLDRMIASILDTKYESIPEAAIKHAKNRIIDTIGCMICGANDAGNPELLKIVRDWGGKPEARVFVHGDRLPSPVAAMVNCIICRSFDYEPVSPVIENRRTAGHISGTTIMTALTIGDMQNSSGKDFLAALLAGDDMAARILIAGKESGTRRGFDHVGQANSFGATAITGKLMGLNHSQMRNAFGLILDHLGGAQRMINDTATAFKLSQGTSARDAVFCVQLAGAGWTGAQDALLTEGGYYSLFTDGIREPETLLQELGRQYYSDGTFKPYPCCRINHAAIDSTLAILNEFDLKKDDIEKIILYMSQGALKDIIGQPFRVGDFPHACAGFSVQYNVASVLLRGSSLPEHFTEKAIRDPAVGELVQKMTMMELKEGNMESARVKLIMKDGSQLERFTEVARGDPANPLSREDLLAKFRTNIEFSRTVPSENAEKIIRMVDNLEKLDCIKRLVDLLVA